VTAPALETDPGAAPADDRVLSVRGLRTEFVTDAGAVRAVRGVSFDLRRGQKLAVVGESGCGKSALALSILGLIEPPGRITAGEVWLNGRLISGLSDRELQKIRGNEVSLVYQDPLSALDPVQTIGDQIAEVIRRHRPWGRKEVRARVLELLNEVEVPNASRRLDDYPHQYSGGMRQRVMIAIALANDPDLLIADEPTTALDVTMQAQVLDLLERLVELHGAAVILVTHNLGIVAEFCDTVRVMYAGRFVEHAGVIDAFARPVHPYTEALLASVPRPDRLQYGPLPSIPGLPPNLAQIPAGCSFEPRCPLGNGNELCRTVEPPDVEVEGAPAPVVAACHFARERRAGTVTA
jgi:oligopeptide/dipeptide ABC transporter ATP-binding protein